MTGRLASNGRVPNNSQTRRSRTNWDDQGSGWVSTFGESEHRQQSEREAKVRAEFEAHAAALVTRRFASDTSARSEILAMLGLASDPVTEMVADIQTMADDINARLGVLVSAGRAA